MRRARLWRGRLDCSVNGGCIFQTWREMRQRCMEVEKAVDGFKSQQMDAVGIGNH